MSETENGTSKAGMVKPKKCADCGGTVPSYVIVCASCVVKRMEAKKVKPKSCASCRHAMVSCGIPRGMDAEHVEAIGLRCDSWEASE